MPAIEITTAVGCKNICSYCPQEKFVNAYMKMSHTTQMSFDTFKACLDKIPKHVDIHFSGMCEPWLTPKCTNMILYTHKKGHRILVSTTLVGMKITDVDLLESVLFKIFAVHLPSAEGQENIEVDEDYIELLNKLLKSKIKVTFSYHGRDFHLKLKPIIKNNVNCLKLITRAGNITIRDIPNPGRLKGHIRCIRNLRQNILLPNGDVILCCMDYGIRHTLGNLLTSDYASLFKGEEFLKVKNGLKDESCDILCRYCDGCARRDGLMFQISRPLRWLICLCRKLLGDKPFN